MIRATFEAQLYILSGYMLPLFLFYRFFFILDSNLTGSLS